MMGYDRAITMFSPDGRLLQVEYAKKTVKQGSAAIGIVCKDGVLLVTDKRIVDPLVISESVEKIFKIDDHLGATAAGILSDARVLVERAQLKAQQNRVTYDSPVDVLSIVKDICSLKQVTTQSGGLRPFGLSLLIAGVDDNGPALYQTDPAGLYWQFKATVIGENDTQIEEILHKEYKETLTIEEGLKIAIKALNTSVENLNANRLDAAIITTTDKKLTRLTREKIKSVLDEIQKKK
ncbi:archaeal proteasome endopeptidase complex subunit alpha [Candidatus Woesearchaeota archaeon]|nr:archaeal proteasome endopeptidase complex subunit alpha [Candidatus Woesearchaeota archaeon]